MGVLTENFRVLWMGAAASIGADGLVNWEEDANFQDRYAECIAPAGAPGANGGNAQHSHLGNNHDHSHNSHSHTITITAAASFTISNEHLITGTTVAGPFHTHPGHPSVSTTMNTTGVTVDSANCGVNGTRPESRTAFFIKPKAAQTPDIPDDCVIFADLAAAPADYATYANLNGKYAIGCAAAAGNGDAAVGSADHTHGVPNHTHPFGIHTHANSTSGAGSGTSPQGSGSPLTSPAITAHTHPITNFSNEAAGNTQAGAITLSSESNEPAYHTLLAIQNTSGGEIVPPSGAILAYMIAGALPADWYDCDGNDGTPDLRSKQVKCTTVGGSVGDTGDGGISSHTHTETGHTHTMLGHNHTATVGVASMSTISSSGRGTAASALHIHSALGIIGTTIPTIQNAIATFQDKDGRATYRTARFVEYLPSVGNPWWYYQKATMGKVA